MSSQIITIKSLSKKDLLLKPSLMEPLAAAEAEEAEAAPIQLLLSNLQLLASLTGFQMMELQYLYGAGVAVQATVLGLKLPCHT